MAHGSEPYRDAVELRRRVLRLPLGLDFTNEELASESDQVHFVAVEDGITVGCLVLVPSSTGAVKMRQVAVAPELHRRGVGRKMVAVAEAWSREQGLSRMTLHARDTAVPFYESLGYGCVGDPFTEVGIPHRRMEKAL